MKLQLRHKNVLLVFLYFAVLIAGFEISCRTGSITQIRSLKIDGKKNGIDPESVQFLCNKKRISVKLQNFCNSFERLPYLQCFTHKTITILFFID